MTRWLPRALRLVDLLDQAVEQNERRSEHVGLEVGPSRVNEGHMLGHGAVEGTLGLHRRPPPEDTDDELHHLAGALVDAGDLDVTLDLLDVVFAHIPVAAEGLDGSLGRAVGRFGGEQLGDRSLDLQVGLTGVEARGHRFDVGAGGLELGEVRQHQLVGVALFLEKGRPELHALLRVGDDLLDRRGAGTKSAGGDHEAGEAEDLIRLVEALAGHATEKVLCRHQHVVEDERRGVGAADAVLLLGLAGREAGHILVDHEEGRATGGLREHREEVGIAAVGYELLVAADAVAGHHAVVTDDRSGRGGEGGEVTASLGLGDRISDDGTLFGETAEPLLPLLVGAADQDGVGTQMDDEKAGGDAEADLAELLRDRGHVAGAAAHAAVLLGQEEELQADLGPQELADGFLGKDLLRVPFADLLGGEHTLADLGEEVEDDLPFLHW